MYQADLTDSLFPAVTDAPYREWTVAQLLSEQATAFSGQPALTELLPDGSLGRRWTYNDLKRDCERLGRALAARHPPGARIAVFAHNLPEWVLLEMAAPLAGLTLVTVNPAFGARELRYVLEQSKSKAIYYAAEVRGHRLKPVIDQASPDLPAILLTDHAALFEGEDVGELRESKPFDAMQIQYTSGTTGFPKGALLHQQGLIQNNVAVMDRWTVQAGDLVVGVMPLFHTAGCALTVLGGLAKGAHLLLAHGFDAAMLVPAFEREKPDFFMGVPTMIVALCDVAEKTGADVTSVKSVLSGGSMVAPELCRKVRQVFQAPVQIIYGQTEASPGITMAWIDDSEADLTGTIGQPYPHMDVAILEPGSGRVLPIGEQGEICCRGFHVMTGYNDNPEATAAAIDQDGWLRTGDLGTMDSRGFLKITGRLKDMIIRGGENLFPAEIENAILEHPALLEAAVVGIPDEKWGEVVACFLRPRGEEKPNATELKAFIRERLSAQKTPAHWVYVDAWPLTGSGKIQRFALRDAFVKGEHTPV
jgi:fatty-acyl-CoA synthase